MALYHPYTTARHLRYINPWRVSLYVKLDKCAVTYSSTDQEVVHAQSPPSRLDSPEPVPPPPPPAGWDSQGNFLGPQSYPTPPTNTQEQGDRPGPAQLDSSRAISPPAPTDQGIYGNNAAISANGISQSTRTRTIPALATAQTPYADSTQRWRDPNAPAPANAPYLKYPGRDPPTAEDLRKALFIPLFSPPPAHWRALIPEDSTPDRIDTKLPDEVLSYIFRRCMDLQLDNLHYATLDSIFPSLLVSHHFSMTPCQKGSHYALARLFIARTKGLGLYVQYVEDPRYHARPERCSCALDLIIDNIAQLVALELVSPSSRTAARLALIPWGAASSLKRFVVTALHPATSSAIEQKLGSLYMSRGLHEIRWDLPTFAFGDVDWSHIMALHLRRCSIDQMTLVRIISSAPALRVVEVEMTKVNLQDVSVARFRPIYALALESLSIEGDGPQDELFHALHPPRLRHLSLRPSLSLPVKGPASAGWPFVDIRILFDFLNRLHGSLEYFILLRGGTTFDETALIRIVEMPQLSQLTLLHVVEISGLAGDRFFSTIHGDPDAGRLSLLPSLQRIGLSACSTTDGVLSRMLQYRYSHDFPLRTAVLHHHRDDRKCHPIDLATFQMLRDGGWHVLWRESLAS
ncbi:hypothetical protein HDZ31DRAFT_45503 [Schizophyllum fasciatum]